MHRSEALAALAGTAHPSLAVRPLGALSERGVTIELPEPADLLGVEWERPSGARIELRFRTGADASWSPWASAGAHGHGAEEAPAHAAPLIGDPIWAGGARLVQVRARPALTQARLHIVDVSAGVGARRQALALGPLAVAAAMPRAVPVLAAGPGQPPIIARRAWAQGVARPRVAPGYGAVQMAFVHHTQNPNGYGRGEVPAMLRAIYAFHRYVNGWNDIGYNFAIDLYGRIFEARAGGIHEPVVGAQAGGYNLVSTGVAVLGSFMDTPISPAARRSLQRLLAWKLALHGLPAEGRVTVRVNPAGARYARFPAGAHVSLRRIAGHRDGDSTDCPGNALYGRLPAIGRRVRRLAGPVVRATLMLLPPPPPVSAPAGESPAEARTLLGSLLRLDGTPVDGARVLIQARTVSRRGEVVGEQTLGEAMTDVTGAWSLPVSLAASPGGSSLRALCIAPAPLGASVSEPLVVPAAVSLTQPAAPEPSPPAAAPLAR